MSSEARKARNAKNMSIEEAATKLRISAGYLSQIEKGQRHVSDERAKEIADLYEVKVHQIFTASRFVINEHNQISKRG